MTAVHVWDIALTVMKSVVCLLNLGICNIDTDYIYISIELILHFWHKSTYHLLPACVSVPPPLNIKTKNECQKCSEWRNVYAIILLDKQYSMPDFFWTKRCILDTETYVQDYSQEIEMAAILKNFPDYKSFQVEMFQCYKGFWDSGLDLRLVL